MPPKKSNKIEALLKLAEGLVTSEDFVKYFEQLIQAVREVKQTNKKEMEGMHTLVNDLTEKMQGTISSEMSDSKQKTMEYCMAEMTKMRKEMDQKMSEMKDGKDADEEKIVQDVLAKIPPPVPVSETAEEIRNKLELLDGKDRLEITAIKDLFEILTKFEKLIKEKAPQQTTVIAASRGAVKAYDLSAQLNGVLKTFALPAFWRVISVHSSSGPAAFRETVDYTVDGSAMTITFTGEITAASTLATGQTLIVVYAEP